jgi:hypothetical protein
MSTKPINLISLAAALAALSGTSAVVSSSADAKPAEVTKADGVNEGHGDDLQPNVLMSVDKDLLGMIVTTSSDGMVTAQHYSHYSHSSHSSHSSHYSSRY